MTENTAAVAALETAAKALTEAAALLASAPAVLDRTGTRYETYMRDAAQTALDALPNGSQVRDTDEDVWTKGANGKWGCGESEPVGSVRSVLEYLPVTIEKVAEVEPSVDGFKVGDRVRVVEGYIGGRTSSVVGRIGEIERIDTTQTPPMLSVAGATARKVEAVEDERETRVTLPSRPNYNRERVLSKNAEKDGSDTREVLVEESCFASTGEAAVYVSVSRPGNREMISVHLTRDEAKKIAAVIEDLAS